MRKKSSAELSAFRSAIATLNVVLRSSVFILTPLQALLFKVLRDRDPARPATRGAFVPLSDLTG